MATVEIVSTMDVDEADSIPFFFAAEFPAGVTVASAVVTVDRRLGAELTPNALKVGVAAVEPLKVTQIFDARSVLPGTYAARCVATRTDGLRAVAVAMITVERM